MHVLLAPLFAAAAAEPSLWEQIKAVPKTTWINAVICIVALVVMIRVWKALKNFNDFAPWLVSLLALALIFFYWVYERAEPRFLTPVVDRIAPFLPGKVEQAKRER